MSENERVGSNGELLIWPQPPLWEVCPTKLAHRTNVKLVRNTHLKASINNKECLMFVDSGTSTCLFRYERARDLGILEYSVKEKTVEIDMWDSLERFTLIEVKDVPVTIKGGPTFLLSGEVYKEG
ncbi:hypothetical protein Pmani_038221 [Petrolisthes manimaculis]|uniref:Uncharacterized protein n=1 Tax=Petrolisthes manimaculis TaxID=1843537 RepID=A0AAE1NGU6_9EUCA|nr:hypothetical protein Pmani_038221 [Petrolisthes manimaculis]